MRRAYFIPLATVLLIGATLQAQLPGNLSTGGLGPVGGVIGRPAGQMGAGKFGARSHRLHGGRGFVGGFVDPFWYGGYYSEPIVYEPEVPVQPPAPAPQIAAPEPQRIPTAPKVTEIPATSKTQALKPLPAAVFVLASGERIESRHYLLTADSVQITIARKRRSIPLDALDLRATTAANRERGLELQVPTGGSEVFLGF